MLGVRGRWRHFLLGLFQNRPFPAQQQPFHELPTRHLRSELSEAVVISFISKITPCHLYSTGEMLHKHDVRNKIDINRLRVNDRHFFENGR